MRLLVSIAGMLALFSFGLAACTGNGQSSASPEQLAAQIAALLGDEDFLAVKPYVTAEFAALPDDAFAVGMTAVQEGGLEDATWSVEQTSVGFAVAHNDVAPYYAYVFKEQDGEWRFDPGPDAMFRAYAAIDEDNESNVAFGDMEGRKDVEGNAPRPEFSATLPVFMRLDDDRFVFAIQVISRHDLPVHIDFRQVEWEIDGEAEPVKLLWATGSEGEQGVFQWPAAGNNPFLLLATDGPVEEGADVTIRLGGVTVGKGEETYTLRFEKSFQAQNWRVPDY